MKKYITPDFEVEKIESCDLILVSAYQLSALEGVDSDGSKSAIFSAKHWF